MNDTITDEMGKISLGKYTLVTRLPLPVKDETANRKAAAEKFHVSNPQYAKSGYGMPVSSGATRMKMTEKTAVFTSGMNIAQPNPMIVCLYRTRRSRSVI